MKSLIIGICSVCLIVGCSSKTDPTETDESTKSIEITAKHADTREVLQYKRAPLNDYVAEMAEQLLASFPPEQQAENILISSLVYLDDYQKTDKLGRLISEEFINQLHIRKFHLIDYKVSGSIQVLPEGDFAITNDFKKLKKHIPADRLLVGTMSKSISGTEIHVRIMNIKQNTVEATASVLIPTLLVNKIMNKGKELQYLVRNGRTDGEQVSVK